MTVHYVYTLTDPINGIVRYVGQGKNRRYANWLKAKKEWEFKYGVYPWLWSLKKIGREPIVNKILEGLTQRQADAWEIGLIDFIGRKIKGTGPLLNITDGGGGQRGVKPSIETRRKQAEANTGSKRPKSEKTRTLQSKSMTGKVSWNKGKSSWNKGKTLSEEHCKHLSEASKGKMKSETHCKHLAEAGRGKIPWNKGKSVPWSDARHRAVKVTSAKKRVRRFWRQVFERLEFGL